MSDPVSGPYSDVDDGWTPPLGTQLINLPTHPGALSVSGGMPGGPRPDPCPHWFRPWFQPAYRALRCGRCGYSWSGHRAANARGLAELARRRGKHEDPCPRCLGSGEYIDAKGLHPWRSCPRCDGWGRVWERKA